ncbi:hypothetical protein ELH51_27320 [Rhizobium ruizarguesonis]|uniref:hypothetical protein n=1 Tax=Rhizobium ruizarguesonis TaxID=2081791 RepID=UPI00102FB460|nr:hypothetical protein [Rhizobium ruizarguesonis]TBB25194.1 hypothetical protein ELH51_27320 [Rhizobium ruizarguesonis]
MSNNSKFQPINDDHAIELVKFGFIFLNPISPQSIAAFEANHDLWRESLPARVTLEIDMDLGGRQFKAPAAQFAFMKPDGVPAWSMLAGANKIEIECAVYSRWDRVWATCQDLFAKALEVLSVTQPQTALSVLELTTKDVFLTEGQYDLPELFSPGKLIPEFLFKAGRLWHSHVGWFQDPEESPRHLHNLNIDANMIGTGTAVSLSHFQQKNMPENLTCAEMKTGGLVSLSSAMRALHDENKRIVTEILVPEMADRIGLGE